MSDLILQRLLSWIDAAPSPYHAASNAANDLTAAGFDRFSPADVWGDSDRIVVSWGGVVVAAALSKKIDPDKLRFRLVGAHTCLLYTSPSPRDGLLSRMPSSA